MRGKVAAILLVCAVLLAPGCATYHRRGLSAAKAEQLKAELKRNQPTLDRETADKILALNPTNVTDADIRGPLSRAPAPRIINIHGGIFPVHARMISFSEFLVGMGYPRSSIVNPEDGTYTFSCYESSAKVAGMIAWYYEFEGLRPMIVGHSQGGYQAVKILRKFAGLSTPKLAVWSPLTWEQEDRCEIRDPLTGQMRPVVGLTLPYATALNSGGLARVLPNQWDMWFKLRAIPDSVEEFTGFYRHKDLLGSDFFAADSLNHYEPNGTAVVRNIRLPTAYKHGYTPNTRHLLKSQEMMDWINAYRPSGESFEVLTLDRKFEGDSRHILWAADVWYSIKKHWVIELQRKIRAERGRNHGH